MSKYHSKSRENRLFQLPSELKVEGDFVLVIDIKSGQPFFGEITKVLFRWNILGNKIPYYCVWIRDFDITITSGSAAWEISTIGIF